MKKNHLIKILACMLALLMVPLGACAKNEEATISDQEMLAKSDSLVASNITQIAKIDAPTIEVPNTVADEDGNYYSATHTGMQGGCFDGRYYYQSFLKYCYNKNGKYSGSHNVNNELNLVVIVKYDVELQKVVKVSEPMYLNHANDMTYNSKLNLLIVAHGSPNSSKLSYVDPETLELKKSFKVNYNLYGIDYNLSTNQYIFGVSGSYGFSVANGLLEKGTVHYGLKNAKAYTTQTLCCDENYVYCLYYGNGTNKLTGATAFTKDAIFVYDWDGNFVTFIEVDFGDEETENISVVDGEIYVATLGILYKVSGLVEAK